MNRQFLLVLFFLSLVLLLVCGVLRIYITTKLLKKYGGLGDYAAPNVDFSYQLDLKNNNLPKAFRDEWDRKVVPLTWVVLISFVSMCAFGALLRYLYKN